MFRKLKEAIRKRPFRVVEALIVLGAALGLVIEPEAQDAILTLAAVLIPALVGGEVAQKKTNSEPFADEREHRSWWEGWEEGKRGTTPTPPQKLPDATKDPKSGKA